MLSRFNSLLLILSLLVVASAAKPLKIILLAGQSNMVGMGSVDHLHKLVERDCPCHRYRDQLWNGTSYRVFDTIYMKYNDCHGPLTIGSNFAASHKHFGPEVGIGYEVANHLTDETVFFLKTAWGGKSLAVDFRPPASGEGHYGPKPMAYGRFYRMMIEDILDTLSHLSDYVPGYNAIHGYELAGFVWFQGWNDMLSMPCVEEYGENLVNLIRDVRQDLDALDMPVIIGELGMHGEHVTDAKSAPRVLGMRAAEHGVTLLPEFRNNSLFVRTAPYAVLNSTKYNGGYHYWGRADTYYRMGKAMGRGVLEMMGIEAVDSDCDDSMCLEPEHQRLRRSWPMVW